MFNIKERIYSGENVIGTMLTIFDNPDIAKLIQVSGFDFFIIDCEHGNFDYTKVAGILAVAREAGIPGFVRVPEARREVVLKYMDMGARGLLLPNTDTPEQAQALVEYSKYAPLGNRGMSLNRAHSGFVNPADPFAYMRKANEETVLMVQIESPTGLANIEHILDVEGIDVAFVGPNDLSQSMGILGEFDNREFIAALERIVEAAKKRNKPCGVHFGDLKWVKYWMEKGMNINLWSSDMKLLCDAAREGLKQLR
jgi:2-keto-3-deoxy-L-rhamnonate aldolase RhmA